MKKYVNVRKKSDDTIHHSTKVNEKLDDLKIFEYFRALFNPTHFYIEVNTYFENGDFEED